MTLLTTPAGAQGNPEYCNMHPEDPRCRPDYCQENPRDPWCFDPNYCEKHPEDPICHKEPPPPQERKDICFWSMEAGPPVAGASVGPAVLTLKCPNHILADWDCGWKDGESALPVPDPTPSTPVCTYLVETSVPDPKFPCARTWTWSVARPDFRTVTAWLRADLWKDVDCDGVPDDWNSAGADGRCALPNVYSPKAPPPPPHFQPKPDGVVDECDMQHYEWQWRQFN